MKETAGVGHGIGWFSSCHLRVELSHDTAICKQAYFNKTAMT